MKLIFNWKCLFFLLFLVLALVLDRAGVRSIWMYNADLRRLLVGESHVLLRLGYRHYTAPGGVVFALTQLWCYLHFGSIKEAAASGPAGCSAGDLSAHVLPNAAAYGNFLDGAGVCLPEADSPEESLAAYRGGGRSNGTFCRFSGHPGELPRLGAADLEA